MDLSTMMSKIDLHEYGSVADFLHDIDLVTSNALEYNPARGHMGMYNKFQIQWSMHLVNWSLNLA